MGRRIWTRESLAAILRDRGYAESISLALNLVDFLLQKITKYAISFSTDAGVFELMKRENFEESLAEFNKLINTGLNDIKIDENDFIKLGGSSRGYAKKAKLGGYWYKVSAGAFNAQAEVVASRLAKYTNLRESVSYEMCKVNGEYATRSADFTRGMETVTLRQLYTRTTFSPIEELIGNLTGAELFRYLRKLVIDKLDYDFLSDITLLLQFDALVLNEDRHFNNIQFINRKGKWVIVPAFDFDCSLYSCLEDLDAIERYHKPSMPFFSTHGEQLNFFASLSKVRLQLRSFATEELVAGVWDKEHEIGKREVVRYLSEVENNGWSL